MNLPVQKYLNDGHTLDDLRQSYAIDYTVNDVLGLVVLNYRPFAITNSALVQDCRGLILRLDNWECVCKPIAAFHEPETRSGRKMVGNFNWSAAKAYPKLDGALVTLYFYQDAWRTGMRHCVDGEIPIWSASSQAYQGVWRNLIQEAAYHSSDKSWDEFCEGLDKNLYYVCEVVSQYNRNMVVYENPDLYLVAVVDKKGKEHSIETIKFPGKKPLAYSVSSLEDAYGLINKYSDPLLSEGFVVVDSNFSRLKFRNPLYVESLSLADPHNDLSLINTVFALDTLQSTIVSSDSSSGSCLPANTLIRTGMNACKPLGNLAVNNVVSVDGNDKQIITGYVNFGKKDVFKIKTSLGDFVASQAQPIVLSQDLLTLPASQLRQGMQLDGGAVVQSVHYHGLEEVIGIQVYPYKRFAIKVDHGWITAHNKTVHSTISVAPLLLGDTDVVIPLSYTGVGGMMNRLSTLAHWIIESVRKAKENNVLQAESIQGYAVWSDAFKVVWNNGDIFDFMRKSGDVLVAEALRRFELGDV